jgi:hypothetical protein
MNNLPKIDYPMYSFKVPSLGTTHKFRPFLVKEEKLLLMAKESDTPSDMLSAIKQIINNCICDKNLDIDKFSIFDLEYLFLKIRSVSIDNMVKVAYKDFEDEKVYEFEVDLNSIEVTFPDKIDNVIKITDTSGIIMKYPSATLYDDKDFLNLEKEYMFELIIRCIDKIFSEDEVFETANYTKAELEEFLENLSMKVFEQIQVFLLNVPKIEYEINYTNSLGNERKVVLSSLNDFFTWR